MLDPAGYSALGHIYDAAVHPGRWRRALDAVAGAVDARAIALLIREPGSENRDRQMLSSAYLDFMRTPWGLYYVARLSRLQNPDWDYLSQQTPHDPTPDTRLDPDRLDRRGDYRMLRRRVGVRRRLGVRLNDDRLWFDAMSIAFDAALDDVPPRAMTRLLPLLPHLTKAAQIGRTFAALKARYKAVLSALDHVRVGLAIAQADGTVLISNAAADRLLAKRDGLDLQAGQLRAGGSDQSAALRAAIAEAARTAAGEDSVAERLFAVPQRSGGEPFLVDVAPLGASTDLALEGALITLIDPGDMPDLRMDRFVRLYGLTAAESSVCEGLIRGESIETIAETRGTSPVTTKNQIAAVLAKTGCRRRAELIRLVIRVLPPV